MNTQPPQTEPVTRSDTHISSNIKQVKTETPWNIIQQKKTECEE